MTFVNESLVVANSISSSKSFPVAILNFVFSPDSTKYVIDALSPVPPPGLSAQ